MTRMEMDDFIREECEADAYDSTDSDCVAECDCCGRMMHNYDDDVLAVVSENGREIQMYCQYCTAKNLRFVKDVLEAAGIWHIDGWADDVYSCAQAEVNRRKQTGNISPRRTLVIQKGVRA